MLSMCNDCWAKMTHDLKVSAPQIKQDFARNSLMTNCRKISINFDKCGKCEFRFDCWTREPGEENEEAG